MSIPNYAPPPLSQFANACLPENGLLDRTHTVPPPPPPAPVPGGPVGWVCPVCGRGNSPYNFVCGCKPFPDPVWSSSPMATSAGDPLPFRGSSVCSTARTTDGRPLADRKGV